MATRGGVEERTFPAACCRSETASVVAQRPPTILKSTEECVCLLPKQWPASCAGGAERGGGGDKDYPTFPLPALSCVLDITQKVLFVICPSLSAVGVVVFCSSSCPKKNLPSSRRRQREDRRLREDGSQLAAFICSSEFSGDGRGLFPGLLLILSIS